MGISIKTHSNIVQATGQLKMRIFLCLSLITLCWGAPQSYSDSQTGALDAGSLETIAEIFGTYLGTMPLLTAIPAMCARFGWMTRLLILRGRGMELASMAGFLRLRFKDSSSALLPGKLHQPHWLTSLLLKESQRLIMGALTLRLTKQMPMLSHQMPSKQMLMLNHPTLSKLMPMLNHLMQNKLMHMLIPMPPKLMGMLTQKLSK